MQLSQFSEVRVTPAHGTVTITAQSELQYASLFALLTSLYLIFEAESLSYTRYIRLAWGFLGPFVTAMRFASFIARVGRSVIGTDRYAGADSADLSGAMLFSALVIIGTWLMDFLAPPQFPPPLFVHPFGLSVRTLNCCLPKRSLHFASGAPELRELGRYVRCTAGPWQFGVRHVGDKHDGVWPRAWLATIGRLHRSGA